MFFQNINYWPVIISAVTSTILGFLWYSPWIFGKVWMKQMGITKEQSEKYQREATFGQKLVKMYAGPIALSLITASVVAALFNSLIITTVGGMITLGFAIWVGFSMPVAANNAMFGKDNLTLFAINAGYQLVNLVIVCLIIGIWG